MEPTKLAGIADWPAPTTVKQVRLFLRFANFYRRFIGKFANISLPLTTLMKKDLTWNWTTECQDAFDTLKRKFQEAPVLLMLDNKKPFILETNALKWASGGVLRQQNINGDWHPCGFISHMFNLAERNYEIYDRELLSIIWGLETWRHYLHGTPSPTVILSDHKNFTYFWTAQKLIWWQARWSLYLSEFDLKLLHTPGSKMIQSDALSCCPDHIIDNNNNDDIILLPDSLFIRIIDTDLHYSIFEATAKDILFASALEALKMNGLFPITSKLEDWHLEDGLLFFKDRCFIPTDEDLRQNTTARYHDFLPGGHPGHLKTLELIRQNYWWPGMTVFVKNYVASCAICQQIKVNMHPSAPSLFPIKAQTNALPFSQVTYDFITDLPECNSFDSLMVMVNHGSSKGAISIPCNKMIDATQTAQNYINYVYRWFGLPESFLSDRGPQFNSHVFKEMMRLLGVKTLQSTAYHPKLMEKQNMWTKNSRSISRSSVQTTPKCGNHWTPS